MSNKLIHRVKMAFLNFQLKRIQFPEFKPSEELRIHYQFSGKVQKVGFRYQAAVVAQKLQLVGWVRNLKNGDVELEVQGTQEKIDFLLMYLDSRSWLEIENIQKQVIATRGGELSFHQLKNED